MARAAQLSSALVIPREDTYPDEEISLSGVAVPHKVATSAILAVQSYISFPSFSSGKLQTKDCLEDLKVNLLSGRSVTGDATFSPWWSLFCVEHRDLYRGLHDRFDGYFLEQMDDWHHRMGTLSIQPLVGFGGSNVSPSADIVLVGSQGGSNFPAVAASAVCSPPETAPSGRVTTFHESDLLFRPDLSSVVTRNLQQRRQEQRGIPSVEKTGSKAPKSKGKGGRR